MRIIYERRGNRWTVGGVAVCDTIEEAVDLAIEALRDQIAAAPTHTLWTVFA